MGAGLFGAMLGSTHPVASALVSAIAGAIIAGATMVLCIATMPDHEFGEREIVVAVSGGAVIFAVMTLCCAKLITIISSSVIGSTMVLLSVDFFLHSLETVKWVGRQIEPKGVSFSAGNLHRLFLCRLWTSNPQQCLLLLVGEVLSCAHGQ